MVTLDTLPEGVVSGKPLTIGFTIRQHGSHPADGLKPTVSATNPTSGEHLEANATPDGTPGHYSALLTFPSAGTWEWQIDPKAFAKAPLPALTVLSAPPLTTAAATTLTGNHPTVNQNQVAEPSAALWKWLGLASGGSALACLVLAAWVVWRGREPALRQGAV